MTCHLKSKLLRYDRRPGVGGGRTFAPNDEGERVRSPADFLRLIVAGVAVVAIFLVAWLFGDSVVVFASDFLGGVDALPDWLLTLLIAGTRLLTIAVLVGGLLWTAVRARWAAPIAMALGGAIAAVLVALLANLADVDEGSVWKVFRSCPRRRAEC